MSCPVATKLSPSASVGRISLYLVRLYARHPIGKGLEQIQHLRRMGGCGLRCSAREVKTNESLERSDV